MRCSKEGMRQVEAMEISVKKLLVSEKIIDPLLKQQICALTNASFMETVAVQPEALSVD
jgi:hypothetical protein